MSIQKLYAHRENHPTEKTKSGKAKVIVTWHTEFDEVSHTRGVSKVGKGKVIEVKKTPFAIGEGVYLNTDKLTDVERNDFRAKNVKRLAQPRLNKALDALDLIISVAENTSMNQFNREQAENIMGHLTARLQRLEEALTKNIDPATSGAKGKVKSAVEL